MNKHLLDKLKSLLQRRQLKEKLAKAAMVMSCLVVFMVTYMLVAPVLTQEWEPQCGLEEHIHTDECYELVPVEPLENEDVPAAEPETSAHHHTEECYTETTKLVCEAEEHSHSEGCYDEEGNLICGKEEHTHTEECEATTRELTCGLEETAEDTEPEAPAEPKMEKVLICGKEEHEHSDLCYHLEEAKGPEYICGYPEEHKHTENCYFEDGTLKCTLTEHIHDDTCLAESAEEIPDLEVVEDPVLDEEFLLEANGFEDLDAALFAEGDPALPEWAFNGDVKVFITVTTDYWKHGGALPKEPGIVSVGAGEEEYNFLWIRRHIGDGDDWWTQDDPMIWGRNYINGSQNNSVSWYARGPESIIDRGKFVDYVYNGTHENTVVWGISDPSGAKLFDISKLTKDSFFNGTFRDKLADASQGNNCNIDVGNGQGEGKGYGQWNKTQYEIVPYVIKFQEGVIDQGWHIDCALVPVATQEDPREAFNIDFDVVWGEGTEKDKVNLALQLKQNDVENYGVTVLANGGTDTNNPNIVDVSGYHGWYTREFVGNPKDYNMELTTTLPEGYKLDVTRKEPADNGGTLNFTFTITKDAPEPQPVTLVFQKIAKDSSQPIQGATFQIMTGPDGAWTNVGSATSDEDGLVTFENLTAGTSYYIHEQVIPQGYQPLPEGFPWTEVILNEDGSVQRFENYNNPNAEFAKYIIAPNMNNGNQHYQFINVPDTTGGPELPATGGSGTTLLYTAGAALVLTSALLMYNVWNPRKRKGEAA